jgi:hypothetical protein
VNRLSDVRVFFEFLSTSVVLHNHLHPSSAFTVFILPSSSSINTQHIKFITKTTITSHLITFEQSCVLSTARHPTGDDNQHARLILLLSVLMLFADLQKNEGAR